MEILINLEWMLVVVIRYCVIFFYINLFIVRLWIGWKCLFVNCSKRYDFLIFRLMKND